jgi:BirA family biotin operon repressor/biotin-[acetyl-CoA-carboxylase] ligase
LFEFEDFDIKLDTDIIGRNFIYMEEVDSTNSYLLDSENKIDIDGTVVLAERQFKGRGRKDRKWYSAKDQNLTFSILLKRKVNEKKIHLLNFGAALAVAYSLENLYQLRINLKWPNDVLADNEKITGILIESISKGSSIEKIVIGFGINVNQTSFQGSYNIPPTSVRKILDQEVSRERLLSELLNNFEEMLDRIVKDPRSILEDWKQRCRMLGEKIVVQDDDMLKTGIFDDIDDEGFLLLKTDDKIERILYGDVSLR